MDKTTRNELVYAKKGIPLTTQTESEKLKGGGGRAGGAAGTAGNIPSYAASSSGSANSDYQRRSQKTENAIDKTISKVEVAPGAVQRLDVALMVDRSVTKSAVAGASTKGPQAIEAAVASAVGLDKARGDTITSTQLAFAKPPAAATASTGPVPTAFIAPLKWGALGLAALLFCAFMLRSLKRREREALPVPAWLSELEAPVPVAALGPGGELQSTQVMPAMPTREVDVSLFQLEQLVDSEPERVAAQVRHWMRES